MNIKSNKNNVPVHTEVESEILLVQLNRPKKRNAINDETLLEIEKIFTHIPEGVKCAIIYATGENFSAGLDLTELTERDALQGVYHSRMWHRVLDKIQFGDVPVIAAINGACIGGGLEIACACHIRVADTTAYYALPEGQRGIFVGGGAAVRLPKLIGMARMADMMLTGRVYKAEEGERIGIAQYLTDEGKQLKKAKELAVKIAANSGMTNYALTNILPRIVDSGQTEGLLIESLVAAIAQDAPEAKLRLRSFLEGKANKIIPKK